MATPTEKSRPYWHVDAKWLCGLALLGLLAVALPVVAAWQLTDRSAAIRTLGYGLAGFTSPQGIDSVDGLQDIKAKAQANGSDTIVFGGYPVTFAKSDFETLSPRELRLKAFNNFAAAFYDLGPEGVSAAQKADAAAAAKFKNDSAALQAFTKTKHDQLGMISLALMVLVLLLAGLLAYFSAGAGRLVSPGLVLLLAGLPGLLFLAANLQHPQPSGTARGNGDSASPLSAVGIALGYLAPLVTGTLARTYLTAAIVGAVLLLAALIVKLVRRRQPKHPFLAGDD